MKIRTGDKVKVIAGKDKGTEGTIKRVLLSQNKVLIDGVNMVTKAQKAKQDKPGAIVQENRPIEASNVMLLDPKTNKPTKIGYKFVDGKKYRFAKKSGEIIGSAK